MEEYTRGEEETVYYNDASLAMNKRQKRKPRHADDDEKGGNYTTNGNKAERRNINRTTSTTSRRKTVSGNSMNLSTKNHATAKTTSPLVIKKWAPVEHEQKEKNREIAKRHKTKNAIRVEDLQTKLSLFFNENSELRRNEKEMKSKIELLLKEKNMLYDLVYTKLPLALSQELSTANQYCPELSKLLISLPFHKENNKHKDNKRAPSSGTHHRQPTNVQQKEVEEEGSKPAATNTDNILSAAVTFPSPVTIAHNQSTATQQQLQHHPQELQQLQQLQLQLQLTQQQHHEQNQKHQQQRPIDHLQQQWQQKPRSSTLEPSHPPPPYFATAPSSGASSSSFFSAMITHQPQQQQQQQQQPNQILNSIFSVLGNQSNDSECRQLQYLNDTNNNPPFTDVGNAVVAAIAAPTIAITSEQKQHLLATIINSYGNNTATPPSNMN